ncbi:MAG: hypothetical protein ACYS6I_00650 [Planctomycetota bacterium]|jgi:hypothetical protein
MRKPNWLRPYRIIRDVILVNLFAGGGAFITYWCVGMATHGVAEGDIPYGAITSGVAMLILPVAFSIVGAINSNNRWSHLAIVTAIIFTEASLITGFISTHIYYYLGFYIVGGLSSMLYPVFRNREEIEGEAKNG